MPMSNRPIKVRLARLFQRTYPSDATRVESAAGPRPCREHDDTISQAIETEAQRYLKTTDAAQYLVLSPRTLEGMRVRADGPPFYKLGRGKGAPVVYLTADLEAWVSSFRFSCTSEYDP